VDALLARGSGAALLALLAAAPDNAAAQAIAAHLATPEELRRVLAREPLDAGVLQWIVARMGTQAAPPLLDALAAAERRHTRWRLLATLEGLGAAIAPEIIARLHGAPWYVQRNLLLLLAKLPVLVDGFSPTPFVRHPDPRVRREAIRMLLRVPGGRAHALRAALADPDPGVVQLGLGAALDECPAALAPVVARHALNEGAESHLRARAARVLGTMDEPRALDALVRVAAPARTILGRPRLAARAPEVVAAIAALHARWRGHPRADEVLALARRSTDAELRAAAGGER
jgi:hypothetical protein